MDPSFIPPEVTASAIDLPEQFYAGSQYGYDYDSANVHPGMYDSYITNVEVDQYGRTYPATPSSGGSYSAPIAPRPVSTSSFVAWQPEFDYDSGPSSGASTAASTSTSNFDPNSPSNDLYQTGSWFAFAQDSYLGAAGHQTDYSTFPPTPQLATVPPAGMVEIAAARLLEHESRPVILHHPHSYPTQAPSPRPAPPSKSLSIVVPPTPTYLQRHQFTEQNTTRPSLQTHVSEPARLGSPIHFQPRPQHRHEDHSSSSPTSFQQYPSVMSSSSSYYPTPTPSSRSTFEAAQYGSPALSSPASPSLSVTTATSYFSFPRDSISSTSSRGSMSIPPTPTDYQPPSPPATPSVKASPTFPAGFSSGGRTMPFPSVLAQPSTLPGIMDEAPPAGTSVVPAKKNAAPPKTPKKRVRPSRAKPKGPPGSTPMKPLKFINFTQRDSSVIVSGVAPSGPRGFTRKTESILHRQE